MAVGRNALKSVDWFLSRLQLPCLAFGNHSVHVCLCREQVPQTSVAEQKTHFVYSWKKQRTKALSPLQMLDWNKRCITSWCTSKAWTRINIYTYYCTSFSLAKHPCFHVLYLTTMTPLSETSAGRELALWVAFLSCSAYMIELITVHKTHHHQWLSWTIVPWINKKQETQCYLTAQ